MLKLFLLMIIFLPHATLNPGERSSNDPEARVYGKWKLARDDEGIKIFTRWVELESNLKVRQIKGEMKCAKPASIISRFIKDEERASKWMSQVLEHKNLKVIGQNEWISYTLFHLPWPFENQDLVAKNTITSAGNHIIIHIVGIPDYLPSKDGTTRIRNFEGSWKLIPDGDSTLIEYTVITKSKALAPRWITDPIIHNNFWATLNNLRNMIQ